MTLRLTAAVAVVVIAIALVAAYIAAQRPTTGAVPAGSGNSVAAYKSMIQKDHDTFMNQAFDCTTVTGPNCAHDQAAKRADLVQWLSDLQTFSTPRQFAVIDAQMRRHLEVGLQRAADISTAVGGGDQARLDNAMNSVIDDTNWLDKVSIAIVNARPATPSDYSSLLRAEFANIGSGPFDTGCTSLQDDLCPHDVTVASHALAMIQADVVQNAAPGVWADRDNTLQIDLAQADDAVMQMETALYQKDATGLTLGRAAFQDALVAIEADLQA